MRFGSVAFFKVLIKTILCIAFFVPLVLCIIFAVVLWNKSADLEKVKYENEKLQYQIQLLGGKVSSAEEFYRLYADSGLSDEELIRYINEKNGETDKLPDTSASDGDNSSASGAESKDNSEAEVPESSESKLQTDTPDESDPPEESVPVQGTVNPYESLYPDMNVRVPASFNREEGVVYLTFDDGPSENTYSVLHYLKLHDIKATFFVVPQKTEQCYSLMKQIVENGHSIGVHSSSHVYSEIYSSVESYLNDFNKAWNMIYEATGVKTEIFRFPGGSKNDYNVDTRDAIIEEMTRRGFRYYDWNVDSNDAGGATWTEMYNSIPADVAENYRSIVLMHDSSKRINTVYVLEDIIKALMSKGYKFDKINNNTQPVQFIGPYA